MARNARIATKMPVRDIRFSRAGPMEPGAHSSRYADVRAMQGVVVRGPDSPRSSRPLARDNAYRKSGSATFTSFPAGSQVERTHDSMRQWCERLTRPTYAFSRDLQNLRSAPRAAFRLLTTFYIGPFQLSDHASDGRSSSPLDC